VLAWGSSLGGLVTAELVERHPDRIAGALPMCGVLAGGLPLWDRFEDMRSALTTLLGRGPFLRVAGPTAAAGRLRAMLDAAQETPQGRARIALVAALGDLPAGRGRARPGRADPRPERPRTTPCCATSSST
jgi:pimeloyl-ACP methyl ester carboxylesterase